MSKPALRERKIAFPSCSSAWDIKPSDRIGQGSVRTVFRACRTGTSHCGYVAKIQHVKLSQLREIQNQYEVAQTMAKLGIGPVVEDAFICELDLKNNQGSLWKLLDPEGFNKQDSESFLKQIENEPFNQLPCNSKKCMYFVVVMQLVNGDTIEQYIQKHPKEEKKIHQDVVNLVSEMYDKGLVMGDPNSANFMRTTDGRIFVVDEGDVYPIGSVALQRYSDILRLPLENKKQFLAFARPWIKGKGRAYDAWHKHFTAPR